MLADALEVVAIRGAGHRDTEELGDALRAETLQLRERGSVRQRGAELQVAGRDLPTRHGRAVRPLRAHLDDRRPGEDDVLRGRRRFRRQRHRYPVAHHAALGVHGTQAAGRERNGPVGELRNREPAGAVVGGHAPLAREHRHVAPEPHGGAPGRAGRAVTLVDHAHDRSTEGRQRIDRAREIGRYDEVRGLLGLERAERAERLGRQARQPFARRGAGRRRRLRGHEVHQRHAAARGHRHLAPLVGHHVVAGGEAAAAHAHGRARPAHHEGNRREVADEVGIGGVVVVDHRPHVAGVDRGVSARAGHDAQRAEGGAVVVRQLRAHADVHRDRVGRWVRQQLHPPAEVAPVRHVELAGDVDAGDAVLRDGDLAPAILVHAHLRSGETRRRAVAHDVEQHRPGIEHAGVAAGHRAIALHRPRLAVGALQRRRQRQADGAALQHHVHRDRLPVGGDAARGFTEQLLDAVAGGDDDVACRDVGHAVAAGGIRGGAVAAPELRREALDRDRNARRAAARRRVADRARDRTEAHVGERARLLLAVGRQRDVARHGSPASAGVAHQQVPGAHLYAGERERAVVGGRQRH